MRIPRPISKLLISSFLVETICVTYALYIPSIISLVSVLYSISGLVLAFCLLWIPIRAQRSLPPLFSLKTISQKYQWLIIAIVLLMMVRFTYQWLLDDPLNYKDADMLPIIKVMCERFLSGKLYLVYTPIPEIWGGIHPIYLPAMWLPFTIPVALHIDLRWVSMAGLFFVSVYFIRRVHPMQRGAIPLIICGFLLLWWMFGVDKAGLVPYTEEGVVIMYYVFLVMALQKQNAWLIGIAASMCVLSRYALVGWLPAMLFFYIHQKEWKNLFRFVAMGATCFLLLVFLPFGWEMIHSLMNLPEAYIDFARRIWHDSPHVFMSSPGWAKFFGAPRIVKLHYLLIALSLGLPLLLMVIVLQFHKRDHIPARNIPVAILKVSLVIFYTFIDVPYLYLFYTSSFVSLIAVTNMYMHERETKQMRSGN